MQFRQIFYIYTNISDASSNSQRTVIAAKRPLDDRPGFDPNRLGEDQYSDFFISKYKHYNTREGNKGGHSYAWSFYPSSLRFMDMLYPGVS